MGIRLNDVSWIDVKEYLDKGGDTVLIPVGSLESHGTHVCMGCDNHAPDKLIELMEKDLNCLIAPLLPYGSTDGLMGYPGTISIGDEGLRVVIEGIVYSLMRHGVKKFVFLNGHGGNIAVLRRICEELSEQGALGTVLNWWLLAHQLNPKWTGGHGGAQETSGMLYVDKKLVNLDRCQPLVYKNVSEGLPQSGFIDVEFKGIKVMLPRVTDLITDSTGWLGPDDPVNSTYEWGKEMYEGCAKFMAEYIAEFEKIDL